MQSRLLRLRILPIFFYFYYDCINKLMNWRKCKGWLKRERIKRNTLWYSMRSAQIVFDNLYTDFVYFLVEESAMWQRWRKQNDWNVPCIIFFSSSIQCTCSMIIMTFVNIPMSPKHIRKQFYSMFNFVRFLLLFFMRITLNKNNLNVLDSTQNFVYSWQDSHCWFLSCDCIKTNADIRLRWQYFLLLLDLFLNTQFISVCSHIVEYQLIESYKRKKLWWFLFLFLI